MIDTVPQKQILPIKEQLFAFKREGLAAEELLNHGQFPQCVRDGLKHVSSFAKLEP